MAETMTIDSEDQRKQAFELFIRALAAAPDSFVKSLTNLEEFGRLKLDFFKRFLELPQRIPDESAFRRVL
ncbi:MAG: transposase family protein [Treponema sp.]|jgi:hypothetical protein|nr:transposase family protein [Treponema sp.]